MMIQWFTAILISLKCSFADEKATAKPGVASPTPPHETGEKGRIGDTGSEKIRKGSWPLVVMIVVVAAGLSNLFINAVMDLSEFNGFTMLILQVTISPLLIFLPAVFRIPASTKVKKTVIALQYGTYFLVTAGWFISLARLLP